MKDRNLEQQLAERLRNRSIAPTEGAWTRIAHNRQQAKNKKKEGLRYYAAAFAACLLSIGFIYLLLAGNEERIVEPQVVYSNEPNKVGKENKPVAVPESVDVPAVASIVNNKDAKPKMIKETSLRREIEPLAMANKEIRTGEILPDINVVVLPYAKTLTSDRLYDEEATLLLNSAIKEAAAHKHLSAPTDDAALLREVEAEMDEYYREKAMNFFSLKHKTIRIAVKDNQ